MSISKFITELPTVKVFAMTDKNSHPFVLSFHYEENVCNLYFQITPNRSNSVTEVPVYEGACHTINTFMDMLTAYGCHYIKRLPITKGEILSRDYLDGLADGIVIAETVSCSNCFDNDDDRYEYISDLLDAAEQVELNGDFELSF